MMRGLSSSSAVSLSAKAKGKRPIRSGSVELLDANNSLPHIPATQQEPHVVRAASYAHPERNDNETRSHVRKREDRTKTRTQGSGTAGGATSEEENMILVMGPTGAGKSRFINRLARANKAREGHSLRSGLLILIFLSEIRHLLISA